MCHRTKALRASPLLAGNVGWQMAGERCKRQSAVTGLEVPGLEDAGVTNLNLKDQDLSMSQTTATAQPISPLRRRMIVRGFGEKANPPG
jgi:hypothetical protein